MKATSGKPLSALSLLGWLVVRMTDAWGLWSQINGVSPMWADLISLLLTAALGIWVGAAWANDLLSVVGVERPDYKKWDDSMSFTLGQTACLWLDREPTQHLGFFAKRKSRKLRSDVYKQNLSTSGSIREILECNLRRVAPELVEGEDPITVRTV